MLSELWGCFTKLAKDAAVIVHMLQSEELFYYMEGLHSRDLLPFGSGILL